MKASIAVAVAFIAMFGARVLAAEEREVTLAVSGAVCPGCARALAAALVEGGCTEAGKITPNQGESPVQITATIALDCDLGALGDAVNAANTPHRAEKAPGVALVLFADLDEASAEAAMEALGKVEGVDAEASAADAEEDQISVKIAGEEELKVDDIVGALKEAGVEATTTEEKE